MRILVATGLYPPESGGPATYTKLLEEHLPAHGFEVSVLAFREVRALPKGLRHFVYFWKCFRRARGADMVFAQDTVSVGFPALLAARATGKKFIVRVPGDYTWEQARQRFEVTVPIEKFQKHYFGVRVALLRVIQQRVVKQAHIVIAPSAYLQKIILGWGVPAEKVALIHNGISFPVPTEVPRERPQGFLVVSVGRRVPWKGFEALEKVVQQEKEWHVFIADKLPRAQALGWVKAADVFVLNSSYEGLSHLLIEAMSLGVPIVATQVGGNPELIKDGVHGILIPPHKDEALYQALKRVHDNREEARALAAAAQIRAQEFSIEKTIPKLAVLLKNV